MKTTNYSELFKQPVHNVCDVGEVVVDPDLDVIEDDPLASGIEKTVADVVSELPDTQKSGQPIDTELSKLGLISDGAKHQDILDILRKEKSGIKELVGVLGDRGISIARIAKILGEEYHNVYQRYAQHVDYRAISLRITELEGVSTEEIIGMLEDSFASESSTKAVAKIVSAERLALANKLYSSGVTSSVIARVSGVTLASLNKRNPHQKIEF